MDAISKLEIFKKELQYIKNDRVRQVVEEILVEVPNYFFKVPASSTGKYHPKMSLGEGGLVRHTKAAVNIAIDLMQLEMFKPMESMFDVIIGCLILHDCLKHGNIQETYTRADHPYLMSQFICDFMVAGDSEKNSILLNLSRGVLTHMGQWNCDYKTKEPIMPKPASKFQNFIHLCDYLASRKYIDMEF